MIVALLGNGTRVVIRGNTKSSSVEDALKIAGAIRFPISILSDLEGEATVSPSDCWISEASYSNELGLLVLVGSRKTREGLIKDYLVAIGVDWTSIAQNLQAYASLNLTDAQHLSDELNSVGRIKANVWNFADVWASPPPQWQTERVGSYRARELVQCIPIVFREDAKISFPPLFSPRMHVTDAQVTLFLRDPQERSVSLGCGEVRLS